MGKYSIRRKRITRLNALRDRVAEWAAERSPGEVERAIRCWLGPLEADRASVMQGIAFGILFPPPGGTPLFERFWASGVALPRADRVLLDLWRRCRFSIWMVLDIDRGEGFQLEDVLTGQIVWIHERSASQRVDPGDWLACCVVPIQGGYELEGTTLAMPAVSRILAVQAYLRGASERGVDVDTMDEATSRELAWGVVEAVRHSQRSPRIMNRDHHDLELITVTLDLTWREVLAATASWDDAALNEGSVTILGRFDPRLQGRLEVATFATDDALGVKLLVNSRERLQGVLSVWESRVGTALVVVSEQVESVDSDMQGPGRSIDSARVYAESKEQAGEEFVAGVVERWPDRPVSILDGLSPRQAVRAGRVAEVRALLPVALGQSAVNDLWEELGL